MHIRAARLTTRFGRTAITILGIGALLLGGAARGTLASHVARQSDAPRTGGTMAFRLTEVPDCLDATLSSTNVANFVDSAIVDPLITLNQQGKPSPNLATSWKLNPNGKVFTFYLRHGVSFSDGEPLNAAAVKWNFERVLNPKSKSPNVSLLGPIKSIKVVNNYTIQIQEKTAFRPLLTGVASTYLGLLAPKATIREGTHTCTNPVGSGPFKVQNVAAAYATITLVRNPLHTWGTGWGYNHGPAHLDKVIFKPIVSDSTAASELLTGGVDESPIPGDQLTRVQHASGIRLYKKLDEGTDFIEFNSAHAPFTNVQVRRAIGEAIDRSAIIRAALNGLGKPAYSALPANLPHYDKKSPKFAPNYNPADARRILQANHVTGPYNLLIITSPTFQTAAELIQAELAQVGVKVNITTKPIGDALATAGKGGFDMLLLGYTYSDPDILYGLFDSSQLNGAGLNYTNYKNPTLDSLVRGGRETLNPAVANRDYVAAQRLINNQGLIDPLYSPVGVYGMRTRVRGWHVNFFTSGSTVVPVYQDLWVSK